MSLSESTPVATASTAVTSAAALPTLQPVDRVEEVYTREYQRLRGLARKSEVMIGCVSEVCVCVCSVLFAAVLNEMC